MAPYQGKYDGMKKKSGYSAPHALRQKSEVLSPILDRIDHLTKLNAFIKDYLEEPLVNYCRVANFRDGCLVIETDSAVWATQLRYLTPDLLNALRSKGNMPQLRSIKTHIQPSEVSEAKKPRSPKLTLQGVKAIKEMLAALKPVDKDS